ncbi:DUF445 domain-containing protein [Bacillus testis]|uniref:DUF445 domain-containing protein n=1 Tax=Bacillus testis TaxID=1622072 RepID=UPI00067F14C8|nr:DUF445 family protein [Bacillus testis]
MNNVYSIIFMIIIGALIGAFTNFIAIRMLFRPYNPMYLFGKKIPFTPGLIPKRRNELAEQVGKLVVEHLLTGESIQQKILTAKFRQDLLGWLQSKVKQMKQNETSIGESLEDMGFHQTQQKIEDKVASLVAGKIDAWMEENKQVPLEQVLPNQMVDAVKAKIPEAADFIIQKGEEYFSSPEGRKQLEKLLDRFFEDKGMLWNMVQMFMKNEKLVDKIQPEILKFLRSEGTKETMTELIMKEWHILKGRDIQSLAEEWQIRKIIAPLQHQLINMLQLDKYYALSIGEAIAANEAFINDQLLPKLMDAVFERLFAHVELFVEKLHLDEIVQEQVNTFSLERLEEIILSIAKRELGMITYLGGFLGGVIGLVQGLVVMLF